MPTRALSEIHEVIFINPRVKPEGLMNITECFSDKARP